MPVVTRTALALLASVAAVAPAAARDGASLQNLPSVARDRLAPADPRAARAAVTVILEMDGESVLRRRARARAQGRVLTAAQATQVRSGLARRQAALHPELRRRGARVLAAYRDAYDGLAVRVPAFRADALASLPGVVAVRRVRVVQRALSSPVDYLGAPQAWQDLGATGRGVTIGVIDSGVDYYHADLGGSGDVAAFTADDGLTIGTPAFPNAKVVGGYDFVGDGYDGGSEGSSGVPRPDPDPLDCEGHGTDVASVAAGTGVLADGAAFTGPFRADTLAGRSFRLEPGVAPEATVRAYRVFGCEGSAGDDVVLAAIDRAVQDRVGVLNVSLGSTFGGADDPLSQALDAASQAGVTVVVSAGNEGTVPYTVGSPAAANRVLAVGAVDANTDYPGARLGGASLAGLAAVDSNDAVIPAAGITAPLAVLTDGDGLSLGCTVADYAGASGRIAVVVRGVCARTDKVEAAQQAGAVAVVLVNDTAGAPSYQGPVEGVTIPYLAVPAAAAEALRAADGTTVTVTPAEPYANPDARRPSGWTSAGPRWGDSALKPEVAAPGVSIGVARVGTGGGAEVADGTSFSAPYVAGVAALVRQVRPALGAAEVKAAVMSTASADPALLGTADVRLVGAGVVQPRRAVDTVAWAATEDGLGSLTFGDLAPDGAAARTRAFTITNSSAGDVAYRLAPAFDGDAHGATAILSATEVTVPAGGRVTVTLTLALTAEAAAALPGADDAAATGALTTVQGVVTATPVQTAAGVYPLRVPFLMVPRPTSRVTPGTPVVTTRTDRSRQVDVPLTNPGLRAGRVRAFGWGLTDPAGDAPATEDVRYAGALVQPGTGLGGAATDRAVTFAVTFAERQSTMARQLVMVSMDVTGDGGIDYQLTAVDQGLLTTGESNGRVVAALFDADGAVVATRTAQTTFNGSTVLLPVLVSEMGLTRSSARVRYAVGALDLLGSDDGDAIAGMATVRPFQPVQSSGEDLTLAAGGTGTLSLSATAAATAATVRGWLLVSLDDPAGDDQANAVAFTPTRGN